MKMMIYTKEEKQMRRVVIAAASKTPTQQANAFFKGIVELGFTKSIKPKNLGQSKVSKSVTVFSKKKAHTDNLPAYKKAIVEVLTKIGFVKADTDVLNTLNRIPKTVGIVMKDSNENIAIVDAKFYESNSGSTLDVEFRNNDLSKSEYNTRITKINRNRPLYD
jgi:hypothetical protein